MKHGKKLWICFILWMMIINLSGCKKEETNVSNIRIVHIDCGRKYFSKESIKTLIDTCAKGKITHIELAIGNDGCRFLLDDMNLEVDGTVFNNSQIKEGIHKGNELYSDFEIDELFETEMDEIIEYAHINDIDIIPLINTPGHMDSILTCIESCGIQNASYQGSVRTIDLSNKKAVLFSQALLEKYIAYFSKKGCTYFSIGADEYANDIFPKGNMGFGQLIQQNKYSLFIDYMNQCAKTVKEYGMIPMAFNDGIYYRNHTDYGTIDTDIVVCYWTNGWFGYRPCSAKKLSSYGFKLINTNSDYYWVLGNEKWQCSETKIQKFKETNFKGGKIENPWGSMFCIWCDEPKADTESNVLKKTENVIIEFGK